MGRRQTGAAQKLPQAVRRNNAKNERKTQAAMAENIWTTVESGRERRLRRACERLYGLTEPRQKPSQRAGEVAPPPTPAQLPATESAAEQAAGLEKMALGDEGSGRAGDVTARPDSAAEEVAEPEVFEKTAKPDKVAEGTVRSDKAVEEAVESQVAQEAAEPEVSEEPTEPQMVEETKELKKVTEENTEPEVAEEPTEPQMVEETKELKKMTEENTEPIADEEAVESKVTEEIAEPVVAPETVEQVAEESTESQKVVKDTAERNAMEETAELENVADEIFESWEATPQTEIVKLEEVIEKTAEPEKMIPQNESAELETMGDETAEPEDAVGKSPGQITENTENALSSSIPHADNVYSTFKGGESGQSVDTPIESEQYAEAKLGKTNVKVPANTANIGEIQTPNENTVDGPAATQSFVAPEAPEPIEQTVDSPAPCDQLTETSAVSSSAAEPPVTIQVPDEDPIPLEPPAEASFPEEELPAEVSEPERQAAALASHEQVVNAPGPSEQPADLPVSGDPSAETTLSSEIVGDPMRSREAALLLTDETEASAAASDSATAQETNAEQAESIVIQEADQFEGDKVKSTDQFDLSETEHHGIDSDDIPLSPTGAAAAGHEQVLCTAQIAANPQSNGSPGDQHSTSLESNTGEHTDVAAPQSPEIETTAKVDEPEPSGITGRPTESKKKKKKGKHTVAQPVIPASGETTTVTEPTTPEFKQRKQGEKIKGEKRHKRHKEKRKASETEHDIPAPDVEERKSSGPATTEAVTETESQSLATSPQQTVVDENVQEPEPVSPCDAAITSSGFSGPHCPVEGDAEEEAWTTVETKKGKRKRKRSERKSESEKTSQAPDAPGECDASLRARDTTAPSSSDEVNIRRCGEDSSSAVKEISEATSGAPEGPEYVATPSVPLEDVLSTAENSSNPIVENDETQKNTADNDNKPEAGSTSTLGAFELLISSVESLKAKFKDAVKSKEHAEQDLSTVESASTKNLESGAKPLADSHAESETTADVFDLLMSSGDGLSEGFKDCFQMDDKPSEEVTPISMTTDPAVRAEETPSGENKMESEAVVDAFDLLLSSGDDLNEGFRNAFEDDEPGNEKPSEVVEATADVPDTILSPGESTTDDTARSQNAEELQTAAPGAPETKTDVFDLLLAPSDDVTLSEEFSASFGAEEQASGRPMAQTARTSEPTETDPEDGVKHAPEPQASARELEKETANKGDASDLLLSSGDDVKEDSHDAFRPGLNPADEASALQPVADAFDLLLSPGDDLREGFHEAFDSEKETQTLTEDGADISKQTTDLPLSCGMTLQDNDRNADEEAEYVPEPAADVFDLLTSPGDDLQEGFKEAFDSDETAPKEPQKSAGSNTNVSSEATRTEGSDSMEESPLNPEPASAAQCSDPPVPGPIAEVASDATNVAGSEPSDLQTTEDASPSLAAMDMPAMETNGYHGLQEETEGPHEHAEGATVVPRSEDQDVVSRSKDLGNQLSAKKMKAKGARLKAKKEKKRSKAEESDESPKPEVSGQQTSDETTECVMQESEKYENEAVEKVISDENVTQEQHGTQKGNYDDLHEPETQHDEARPAEECPSLVKDKDDLLQTDPSQSAESVTPVGNPPHENVLYGGVIQTTAPDVSESWEWFDKALYDDAEVRHHERLARRSGAERQPEPVGPPTGPPAGPSAEPPDGPQVGPSAEPPDGPPAGPSAEPPDGLQAGPPAGPPDVPSAEPPDVPPAGPPDAPLAGPSAGPPAGPLAGPPAGPPPVPGGQGWFDKALHDAAETRYHQQLASSRSSSSESRSYPLYEGSCDHFQPEEDQAGDDELVPCDDAPLEGAVWVENKIYKVTAANEGQRPPVETPQQQEEPSRTAGEAAAPADAADQLQSPTSDGSRSRRSTFNSAASPLSPALELDDVYFEDVVLAGRQGDGTMAALPGFTASPHSEGLAPGEQLDSLRTEPDLELSEPGTADILDEADEAAAHPFQYAGAVVRGCEEGPPQPQPPVTKGALTEPASVKEGGLTEPASVTEGGLTEPATVTEGGLAEPSSNPADGLREPSPVAEDALTESASVMEGGLTESASVTEDGLREPSPLTEGALKELTSVTESGMTGASLITEGGLTELSSVTEDARTESASVMEGGLMEPASVAQTGLTEPSSLTEGALKEPTSATESGLTGTSPGTEGGLTEAASVTEGGLTDPMSVTEGGLTEPSSVTEGGLTEAAFVMECGVTEPASITEGGLTEPSPVKELPVTPLPTEPVSAADFPVTPLQTELPSPTLAGGVPAPPLGADIPAPDMAAKIPAVDLSADVAAWIPVADESAVDLGVDLPVTSMNTEIPSVSLTAEVAAPAPAEEITASIMTSTAVKENAGSIPNTKDAGEQEDASTPVCLSEEVKTNGIHGLQKDHVSRENIPKDMGLSDTKTKEVNEKLGLNEDGTASPKESDDEVIKFTSGNAPRSPVVTKRLNRRRKSKSGGQKSGTVSTEKRQPPEEVMPPAADLTTTEPDPASTKQTTSNHVAVSKPAEGHTAAKAPGAVPVAAASEARKQTKTTPTNKKAADGGGGAAPAPPTPAGARQPAGAPPVSRPVLPDRTLFLPEDEGCTYASLMQQGADMMPARPVFLAHACHVCKRLHTRQHRLKSCGSCRLVAYCSAEHQRAHWPLHRTLCKAVTRRLRHLGTDHLYREALNVESAEQWKKIRFKHMAVCEEMLGRPMEAYEKEMFLYPRACDTCHETNPEKLQTCASCHSVSFCVPEHLRANHSKFCKDLRLLLEIHSHQNRHGVCEPPLPDTVLTAYEPLPPHIREFLVVSMLGPQRAFAMGAVELAVLSDYASYPLTLLYALQNIPTAPEAHVSQLTELTVHVVGAEFGAECDPIARWDVFLLNVLPQLRRLHVVFVGPELEIAGSRPGVTEEDFTCAPCRAAGKRFTCEFRPSTHYHTYCRSPQFRPPHVICAFNAGLHRFAGHERRDSWLETIPYLVPDGVPLVITGFTMLECPQDVARIQQEQKVDVLLPPMKNPYRSTRPQQNFLSEHEAPVVFRNQYVACLTAAKARK